MELSRRKFLTMTAGAALGIGMNGCAQNPETVRSSNEEAGNLERATLEETIAINNPATANERAVRGSVQTQIGQPPGPPQSWSAGDFVLKANVDFLGMAPNYDDGPSPYNTDPILRSLEAHNAFATFYIIGVNAIAWPEIVRRIRDAGHEIGLHSQTHSPYRAPELAYQTPIVKETVRNISGITAVSNRNPGLTKGQIVLDICRNENLYEAHTTIDSKDWEAKRISAEAIVANVLGPLHPGAFPLQHDGGSPRPTPDAQDAIFREAKRRGYKLMTVTDLINAGTPNPGGNFYSSANLESGNLATEIDESNECMIGTSCNYSPEEEFRKRLNDPTVKSAERSRIVEALAILDDAA